MLVVSNLQYIKLRVILQAEESGRLPPFLGSTIRGVLGHSMRDLVCLAPKVKCHTCIHANNCHYATYFNPPGSVAGSVKPYVIYTPLSNKTHWYKGDLLSFDITFFGDSILAIDYLITGLLNIENYGWGAQRLSFSLKHIINQIDGSLVWSGGNTWLDHLTPTSVKDEGRLANSVLIRLNSPTRILVQQKLLKELQFKDIIQAIMTRMKLIYHGYVGLVLEWDEERLLEGAEQITRVEAEWEFIDFKRYSFTYNRQLKLPSIMGYARFEGNLTPYTPLLELGQLLQIGKNTTHGFGHYNLYYA